jgi:preprotein translocase subunit SecE
LGVQVPLALQDVTTGPTLEENVADKDEVDPTPSDAETSADALPDELSEDRGPEGLAIGGGTVRKANVSPKGTPTARRDAVAEHERTTPAKFVRQSVGELRKVVYPTGNQLVNYFVVVLVFVLFIIAFVSLLDLGLGWAVFKVFS